MMRARRATILTLAAVIGAAALVSCGGGSSSEEPATMGGGPSTTGAEGDGLAAIVASYDLAPGPASRFIVGLATPEREFVGYGTIRLRFARVEKEGGAPGAPGEWLPGTFLAIPGVDPPAGAPEHPTVLSGDLIRGVYATEVGFDAPGFWQVEVAADVDGEGERTATAAFEVGERHQVPAPGEPAPASENLTVDTPGADPAAVDSRAGGGQPVPDPDLHGTTIAAALAAGRPTLVVFATPVYCVSRFCGPVTDMVEDLAGEYADRAAFVHVEIWKDFEGRKVNETALEWLQADAGLQEPWVFLIGADGRITARWDNVATAGEIRPLLEALPAA